LHVTGRGALAYLQRLTANDMDRPIGRVVYTAMLNERGGVVCDLTRTPLGPGRVLGITRAARGLHDPALMGKTLPEQGSVQITDGTSGQCALGIWGPKARDLLQAVCEQNLAHDAFPPYTGQALEIGCVPALALRISYVGELGWEIYAPTEYGVQLWDTLWEAGRGFDMIAVGGGAFDSLRLEKGYRSWGIDIHSEYNPYEAGLGFAVRLDKGDFLGRGALQASRSQGLSRRLC